ncbi:MAG TPA: hypothetical protein VHN15_09365 [Thermoanaerobaculia bacterium]|nr:hypothetical protein [Thermoanaerobaculia bacterium]
MNGAMTILRREVAERRLLFAGAAVLGLLPLAAPFLPGGYREMRGEMAAFLGQILSGLLAVALGATVLNRDLAERRLSFYFSRPVSGGALWAGKLGAAALLAGVCGILVAIPGWLASGSAARADSLFPSLLAWGLAVLGLVLVAHAAGLLLRERSTWLLLDFVAFCTVATLIYTVRRNSRFSGTGVFEQISVPALAAGIAILTVASAWQLLAGRTDLHRGRRLLSLGLWPPLLALAAALAVYSYRVVEAEPQDLTKAEAVVTSPTGSWVAVAGPVAKLADYRPGVLFDTRSGRSVTLPETLGRGELWTSPPAFSADGRRAVWVAHPFGTYPLLSLDLDRPGAEPVLLSNVGQVEGAYRMFLDLSPDGRYLAQRLGYRLIVSDLVAGRLVTAVDLPASRREEIRFAGPRVLRVFTFDTADDDDPRRPFQIQDVDLETGRVNPPLLLPEPSPRFFLASPDGRRLLLWSPEGAVGLYDGANGRRLADVAPAVRGKRLAFLADGRILVALPHPQGTELRVVPPDGAGKPRRHLLAGIRNPRFGGQPAPERLVALTFAGPPGRQRAQAWQIDLASGAARALPEGLEPLSQQGQVSPPEAVASRLFLRGDTLVLLDPATGREQALTGAGAFQR